MIPADALRAFEEQAALAAVTGGSSSSVILAACDLLVEDWDGPATAELAGLPLDSIGSDVFDPLHRALEELGLRHPDGRGDEARALALRAMCRSYLAGTISARQLSEWVWRTLGYETPDAVDPFHKLEYQYDIDGIGDPAQLDEDARAIAQHYLALSLEESVARRPPSPPKKRRWPFRR